MKYMIDLKNLVLEFYDSDFYCGRMQSGENLRGFMFVKWTPEKFLGKCGRPSSKAFDLSEFIQTKQLAFQCAELFDRLWRLRCKPNACEKLIVFGEPPN